MKKSRTNQFEWLLASFVLLFLAGCATANVNPPAARANTGYVDFRAESAVELSWDVARFNEGEQKFNRLFSDLKPPQGGILRLAFAPGRHRLRITFLNRVIVAPVEIEVHVQDGKITPVRIALSEAGTTLVRTESTSRGNTAYGRPGRRTKIGSDESTSYNLAAVADPTVSYQPKEQMPYAR